MAKRSTGGEIVRHIFTRNRSTCKYWVLINCDNVVFLLYCGTINFRNVLEETLTNSLSPLIQVCLLRRSNDVFILVIYDPFDVILRFTINRVLLWVRRSTTIARGYTHPSHQTPDTSAFLYYFTSSERPRMVGELRLWIVSNDDVATFESGSDLLRVDGRPWSLSLYKISKYDVPLYEKLGEDGLVQTTWTQFYRLFLGYYANVKNFIH